MESIQSELYEEQTGECYQPGLRKTMKRREVCSLCGSSNKLKDSLSSTTVTPSASLFTHLLSIPSRPVHSSSPSLLKQSHLTILLYNQPFLSFFFLHSPSVQHSFHRLIPLRLLLYFCLSLHPLVLLLHCPRTSFVILSD